MHLSGPKINGNRPSLPLTEKDKKVDNSQEDEITVQRIIIAIQRGRIERQEQ